MSLSVYLSFNGNCEEVMNFYKDKIGAKVESIIRIEDVQGKCDGISDKEEDKKKIIHAVMYINDTKLMCSDCRSDKAIIGDNFSLSFDFKNIDEIQRTFDALSNNGGTVTMPIQDTFWNAKFGMCKDKFGIHWMFNYDKLKS
ncbi:unnamed protein product [Didymodactylos carnosus]|uniref:Glyoxalase/fosfomycin resistance/dioxygenase domain-containing protein n=1 Tax=Didymodactylos carnosus TaxID=1234261 RepID=A0A816BU86_9BILA|nr:unnamed protein product [Didymodactylos carnosus]CAF1615148.1 unnamed protein product [Didymodactylos carnosus]CAF4013783.1 unnamed protein product [Didymodactylos carnosus]CAF4500852.1 unnamed protein product [Didymodactylos carnosus]